MIAIVVMGAQYAFLYGIDFLFAGDGVLAQLVGISYTALDVGLLAWIVIYLGICVAVFLIGRAVARLLSEHIGISESVKGLIRILLTCAVFIGAIIYRGVLMITSGAVLLTDSTYYDAAAAMFTDGTPLGDLAVHGASFVYIMILTVVMQFLGDRAVAVVLLQVVIQIITIMLTFAAFRRLVNFCTGFTAAIILTISPLYTAKIFSSSPGCFVALLVLLGIYLISLLRRIHGGVIKSLCGVVFGLIIGYLIYMDVFAALALVVWFFALMHEVGDEESEKYLPAYLLVILGAIISLGLSLGLDGGFDPDGIDIAVRTWMKVTSSHIVPEYALIDPALGVFCMIQCLIMVGFGAMTIMGTVGRRSIEYELPWIMMLICALTPMTRTGYLQDNTLSLIMYCMLAGAGVSSMIYTGDDYEDDEDDDEDDDSDDDGSGSDEIEIEILPEDDIETIDIGEKEDGTKKDTAAPAAKPEPASKPEPSTKPEPEPAPASETEPKATSEPEPAPASKPEPEPAPAAKPEPEPEPEPEEEVLPTSIPWAEIRKLDEEDSDDIESYFVTEEVYDPDEEAGSETSGDEEDGAETSGSEEEPGPGPESETGRAAEPGPMMKAVDLSTTQVDDLPGMIPNPLPLPPKKAQVKIDYDLDDDDLDEEDDLDWGRLDDDDIEDVDDDEDDFDI